MTDAPHPGPSGRLFVVSTPIGNMGDFTFRAVETLRAVTLVLAEDTRHSRPLLDRYEIATPLASYHEHNEARMVPRVLEALRAGSDVALVSDAGTPLVSDPGGRLVRAVVEAGFQVVPIPGASALLAALVGSGLGAERFTFFGFLPRKGRERTEALRELASLGHTAILYEAPGRVADTLADLAGAEQGSRAVVVARELTKTFEEFRRGTLEELAAYYRESPPRGEVVIVLGAAAPSVASEEEREAAARARAHALRASGMTARDVAAALAQELGLPRNQAYRLAQES